ncbi:c-type cytochrome [Amaricoccus solimangrovi]|uniref:Cytochrome c n=1 Tax=Amaricoccus solimangrovi TaxID=2589815 RepID=A0A501WU57_9RHOB|nr:cytochrome c [Amaricoccus solimangrovi]TPE53273.1 cytochrome c [Amaricoccus solimangrovi]
MRRALLTLAVLLSGPSLAEAGAGGVTPRTSYALHCSGCHTMTGTGEPAAGIPTFIGSVGTIARSDTGRTYMMHVPGVISAGLSDEGIAEVMNYVLEAWGNGAPLFTAAEVTERRAVPVPDVVDYRRGVVAALARDGGKVADYPWP